tara:strand:- start:313 stop:483 length:171 start_codon:yes stop_codon:yes gene_type:complete
MGRVSDWLIEMEEDVLHMTQEEWMAKHGESVIDMYDQIKRRLDGECDEPSEPANIG